STTCASDRRWSRRAKRCRGREKSHERARKTAPAAPWTGPPLHLPGAAHALAVRVVLRLSPPDRARLLVPLALLARGGPRRGDDLPYPPSLGGPDLRGLRDLDVSGLGAADAEHAARPGVVARPAALRAERRRPGPARGPLQSRPEGPLLGLLLVRDRALPDRP